MKKLLAILLALMLVFAFAACGGGGGDDTLLEENKNDDAKDVPKETVETVENEDGDYIIEIDGFTAEYLGYEIITDTDGDPALVCTYEFTNNSEASESFEWAFYYSYFQDGVELEYSVVRIGDSYDYYDDETWTEIQPGYSIEVCTTYKLNNTESPVTAEFEGFYSDEVESFTIYLK